MFPTTTLGSNPVMDIAAVVRVLTELSRTPEQLRAMFRYIRDNGKSRFWKRPYQLMKSTDQGNGPLAIVQIEMDMEAAKAKFAATDDYAGGGRRETAKERTQRVMRERKEREKCA